MSTAGSSASELAAMRLLIVDDAAAVRRLVSNRLERQGVRVTSAPTTGAALIELRHTPFDVVILDLELADGSGSPR
jgi:DNA-binding response OmpR family regulator